MGIKKKVPWGSCNKKEKEQPLIVDGKPSKYGAAT
jgi:hypothetical protein